MMSECRDADAPQPDEPALPVRREHNPLNILPVKTLLRIGCKHLCYVQYGAGTCGADTGPAAGTEYKRAERLADE